MSNLNNALISQDPKPFWVCQVQYNIKKYILLYYTCYFNAYEDLKLILGLRSCSLLYESPELRIGIYRRNISARCARPALGNDSLIRRISNLSWAFVYFVLMPARILRAVCTVSKRESQRTRSTKVVRVNALQNRDDV